MRGKKAKALRRAERPNPGRKHGGEHKEVNKEYVNRTFNRAFWRSELGKVVQERINRD